MDKKQKLEELKSKLADLKKLDPSHCSGHEDFMNHTMPPELFQEMEDLEQEIKNLEKQGD